MNDLSKKFIKKSCLVILFASLTGNAFSQFILSEDFQQGIPGTWTLLDKDGLTPDSTQTDFVTDAWVAWDDPFALGDTIAVSTSKYLPPGQADDWLITPAITLGSNSLMNWYALAFDASADGYEVRISTSTPTDTAFLANAPLFSIGAENITWTKRSADLTAYANQTVYIAFRNNSTDKFILGIDDVVIFDCGSITADAGVIDTSTTTACSGFPALDLGLSPSFLSGTPTTNISGNTNDVPNWNPLPGRPFEDDGSCCWGVSTNPPYQVVGFQVTVTGNYNILQTQSGYDGVIYIYTDPFDLTVNPPVTFVSGNDDDDVLGTGWSGISGLALNQNQNYYLVSSGFGTTDTGSYSTDFTGPGSIILSQGTVDDRPLDYNYVVSTLSGTIVSIGDDLTNNNTFPGSANGDTFNVCGIAYSAANLNLSSFIGQPYSNLVSVANSNSCVDLTDDCHVVVVLSGGVVDAGIGDTVCANTPVTLTASGSVSYVWSNGATTTSTQVIPPYTTIYSVTGTDGIGCTASDNVTVKVFASDGGKFNTTPTVVCEGDSALNFSLEPDFFFNFSPAATNTITGNTASVFTWAPLPGRPFTDGTCCSGFNPIYDIKTFQVDQPGYYFISQTQLGYDGIIYLYTDPFDLTANPPITFIAANDDSATSSTISRIDSAFLEPSKVYYLISTGFDAGEYGDYVTTITGAGNILLPAQPDTNLFGFEFLALNGSGTIVDFTQDLGNSNQYPGAATGNDYQVCAVSYLKDSVNIALYLGQPISSLSGVSCLDLSDNCHSVTIFTHPVADAGPNDSICFNDTVTLAANPPAFGTGRWKVISGSGTFGNPFSPASYVTGLAAGLNSLEWTLDNGGCSDSDTMSVFVELPSVDAGPNDTICKGDTATLTAAEGIAYLWSSGQSAASINVSPLVTTKYSVTITAASGCILKDTVTVKVNPLPVVNIANATICPGSCTILNAGNPGASYSWSNSATTQSITVCSGGTSHVTVTDTNGCVNSDSAVVSIGSGLTVVLDDISICEGDSVTFDAGNQGASYQWSTGDSVQTITVGDSGTIYVYVVDSNNCSGSDTATVTLLPLPSISTGNDQSICEGESATLTATGSGSFEWNTGDTTASLIVTPSADSTYSVTVTSGNGCKASDEVFVMVTAFPIFDLGTDISICNGESATLTASGGGTYNWSTSEMTASITVSPVSTTTYSVTVTANATCSSADTVTVNVNTPPVANAGADVIICSDKSTTLTATGGGTYLWNNGNANASITVSPAASQFYSVIVTSANGCTDSDSVFVEVNPLPEPGLDDEADLCLGELLTITAFGGGTYLWSTNATTEYIDVSPTSNQTYSVTVTSNDGCTATDAVNVIIRPAVNAQAGPDATICDGDEITLTATGGTIYEWSNGSTSNSTTVSPSATTDYTVTVSNVFDCEDVALVTVTVKPSPTIDAIFAPDTICVNQSHLILGATPVGGTFSGAGVSNDTLYPAAAGLGNHVIYYSLTGPNGCTGTDSVEITVDICSGLYSPLDEVEISIYPNPAEQFFFVRIEGLKTEVAMIKLYDAVGKMVVQSSIKNEIKKIDMTRFSSGTYLLQIVSTKGLTVKQIIKN